MPRRPASSLELERRHVLTRCGSTSTLTLQDLPGPLPLRCELLPGHAGRHLAHYRDPHVWRSVQTPDGDAFALVALDLRLEWD